MFFCLLFRQSLNQHTSDQTDSFFKIIYSCITTTRILVTSQGNRSSYSQDLNYSVWKPVVDEENPSFLINLIGLVWLFILTLALTWRFGLALWMFLCIVSCRHTEVKVSSLVLCSVIMETVCGYRDSLPRPPSASRRSLLLNDAHRCLCLAGPWTSALLLHDLFYKYGLSAADPGTGHLPPVALYRYTMQAESRWVNRNIIFFFKIDNYWNN